MKFVEITEKQALKKIVDGNTRSGMVWREGGSITIQQADRKEEKTQFEGKEVKDTI